MRQFASIIAAAPRTLGRLMFSGLKNAAHRNPGLLAAARATRKWMFTRKPRLVRGFDPLVLDEDILAGFTAIAPSLAAEMLVEFAEIARELGGVPTGLSAYYQWLAQHPLDDLLASAAELNLVYTPGKVGTTTAVATLQRHPSIHSPVRSIHYLSSKGHAFLEERRITRCTPWPATAGYNWRDYLFQSRMLRVLIAINRALRAPNRPGADAVRKPYVVTGVREPVALHVSRCFEGWWQYGNTPDVLTAEVVRQQLAEDAWPAHCNQWFSDELRDTFGIDVFARPFPTERGWDIYENDAARVLLIRLESLAALPAALGELYGFDPSTFSVVSANTAEGKDYAVPYDVVKKTLRLSRQELEEIYALPYVRHFYTPREIAELKSRWQTAVATRKAA
jgi:hypothetical protein